MRSDWTPDGKCDECGGPLDQNTRHQHAWFNAATNENELLPGEFCSVECGAKNKVKFLRTRAGRP